MSYYAKWVRFFSPLFFHLQCFRHLSWRKGCFRVLHYICSVLEISGIIVTLWQNKKSCNIKTFCDAASKRFLLFSWSQLVSYFL